MPGWVLVLEAAREWGTPPWRIEDEASQLWWDRWLALRSEVAQARRDGAKSEGGGG